MRPQASLGHRPPFEFEGITSSRCRPFEPGPTARFRGFAPGLRRPVDARRTTATGRTAGPQATEHVQGKKEARSGPPRLRGDRRHELHAPPQCPRFSQSRQRWRLARRGLQASVWPPAHDDERYSLPSPIMPTGSLQSTAAISHGQEKPFRAARRWKYVLSNTNFSVYPPPASPAAKLFEASVAMVSVIA